MLDNLYENIGDKIKIWAKWIFIIEAIGAIIAGMAMMVAASDIDEIWFVFGILIIIFGPIVAWVSSLILYAFGQLVEDMHEIRNQNSKISNINKNVQTLAQPMIEATEEKMLRNVSEKATSENSNQPKITVEKESVSSQNNVNGTSWYCLRCHSRNLLSNSTCWNCNSPK